MPAGFRWNGICTPEHAWDYTGTSLCLTIQEFIIYIKLTHFYINIQSQKTAELLLDLKVDGILCSPQIAAVDTATVICEVTVM